MTLVDCGHPMGCKCEDRPLERVPCGEDTMAVCRAALAMYPSDGGFWWRGAATHRFADLLAQLRRDGYVLAKERSA